MGRNTWHWVYGAIFAATTLVGPTALLAQAVRQQAAVADRDAEPERLARVQPPVPPEYREVPFVETAPAPQLTEAEQDRGFLLFHRPITEPVYPNTHPRPHERLDLLSAFVTPGEFEPVTFSLYPIRDLQVMRVQVSDLTGSAGSIPAECVTIRLVTYWNMGFPRYTSRDTYRRVPELLERVTAHSSPAGECQRWWLTVRIPEDAQAGVYRATITIDENKLTEPVTIPLHLKVLGFQLKSDPAKHYSVYYYTRNSVPFQGKDESFIERATGNEYQAMVDYGVDTVPTLSLQTDETGRQILLRDAGELDRMLAIGLRGPVPITAGNVIARIYRDTTPGGRREKHWAITKMPPPEFYARVTEMFRAFEAQRRKRGWPEFVCCPIDEVAASHQEFGSQVYRAVQRAGVRTYATKDPLAADAKVYSPYVDVWCSQPYSATYEKIVAQDQHEYWCYPNHNAGEIKDRRVMCKGGRMTYGFGFWRSGYTTLIPWHWSWTPRPDQFDYLRGSHSGCGQRIGDDAEVIPAIYWECFREGRDDARYVYTLQQVVWEREPTRDPRCLPLVSAGKEVLQETWDVIQVQQKYLADGMWPDAEFNARRWRLAALTEALLKYPPVRHGLAPSVFVEDATPKSAAEEPLLIERAIAAGNVEVRDLGEGFAAWRNGTKEGTASVTRDASQDGQQKGLRWQVSIDHQHDGGEGGTYPVGWPRIARSFGKNELDLSQYDYLEFLVRVQSDRDEVADDSTPLGLTISSHQKSRSFFEARQDLGDRQGTWIPVRYSIQDMMRQTGLGAELWQNISRVQIYLRESDYAHGTKLQFDISHVRLLRFRSPVITNVAVPSFILLPQQRLTLRFEIAGTRSIGAGTHQIRAVLASDDGQALSEVTKDMTDDRLLILDTSHCEPGTCFLKVDVLAAEGQRCSGWVGSFKAVPGPFWGPPDQD